MPLILKSVEPSHGMRWVRDGFTLFARRPLAFATMFVLFLLAALVCQIVPLVGGFVQMAALPLLSLGFMVASQSALLGGPVKPTQFIEPLRGDRAKRRALIQLCLIFGISALAILLLCDAMSNHAMQRVQALMVKGAPDAQIAAIAGEPGVRQAILVGVVLGSLLSVPFWHAPALVHWGGQGVGQALFSSTLALWRSKGAFLMYALTWTALIIVFGMVASVLFSLLGAPQLASLIAMPAGLLFSTVFYVSLLFTFNDSFGGAIATDPAPG